MRSTFTAALALVLLVGCKPKPVPQPPADSTAVVDSAGQVQDSPWVDDSTGIDLQPPVSGPFPKPRSSLRTSTMGGLGIGLYNWPKDQWCNNTPMNIASVNVLPSAVVGVLKAAALCGMRIQIVIPRRLITTTGQAGAPFSMTRAKATINEYRTAGLPGAADTYSRNFVGMLLGDDYGCAACWGGKVVTQDEVREWAAYANQQLPGVPLGIRVEPWWANAAIAKEIDNANCQYRTKKGPLVAYLDKCLKSATALGLKLIEGQNFTNCSIAGDSPACSNTELSAFGNVMVNRKENCAFISWWYDNDYSRALPVWQDLARTAATKVPPTCERGG